jgi:hypothetical protein
VDTITVSVKCEFNLNAPVKVEELFVVVQQAEREVGHLLVQELCHRLEAVAEAALKATGYVRHDFQPRTLQRVLGTVRLKLLRMKSPEGKVGQVLDDKIVIPPYVRHTKDGFAAAVGLVPYISYNRSAREGQRIVGSGPGKSVVHRQVKAWAPDLMAFPQNKAKGFTHLVVDGTGAFFQEWAHRGNLAVQSYAGEMRLVLASRGAGKPFRVVGRWTNTPWADIAQEVYRRIDVQDVRLLISDGGPGIAAAFLRPSMRYQRCTVHAWRDLVQMLYADGLKKDAQQPIREALSQIPVMQFNQQTMESLQSIDREYVTQAVEKSAAQLKELAVWLYNHGYHKTARYIDNLQQPLLTFLHGWLQHGEADPATSNVAENRMSLIKNRIVRIGRRWSEPGLQRRLDLAINKMFPGYDWSKLWDKLLPLSGNLTFKITVLA